MVWAKKYWFVYIYIISKVYYNNQNNYNFIRKSMQNQVITFNKNKIITTRDIP